MNNKFLKFSEKISKIGREYHKKKIIDNSTENIKNIQKTINDIQFLKGDKKKSGIVVSAGPSLHKLDMLQKIKNSDYSGTIISIDGSYLKCLKNGIVPDYVLTIDPHETRIVRWFGDPEFEINTLNDDYFDRQDLDEEFRNNSIADNLRNIELVNKYAKKTKLIICCTSPKSIYERCTEAGFNFFWWAPVVDDPFSSNSLTHEIYSLTNLPSFNTGGNVGTAAWVFAKSILEIENVAVIGMDLGYYKDTPFNMTQTYYELENSLEKDEKIEDYFINFKFPRTQEVFYTDPTYYWYRTNLLAMLDENNLKIKNCTGGGTLFGKNVILANIETFLKN